MLGFVPHHQPTSQLALIAKCKACLHLKNNFFYCLLTVTYMPIPPTSSTCPSPKLAHAITNPVVEQQVISTESSLPDVAPSRFFTALQAIQKLFKTLYDCSLGAFIACVKKVFAYLLRSSEKVDLSAEVDSFKYIFKIEECTLPRERIGELQRRLNLDNITGEISFGGKCETASISCKNKLGVDQNITVSKRYIDFEDKYGVHSIFFKENKENNPNTDNGIELSSENTKKLLAFKLADFCEADGSLGNKDKLLLISDLLAEYCIINNYLIRFLINPRDLSQFAPKASEGKKSYAYFISRENDDIKLSISCEKNRENEVLNLNEAFEENQPENIRGWKIALKINVSDQSVARRQPITIEDFTYRWTRLKTAEEMAASNNASPVYKQTA